MRDPSRLIANQNPVIRPALGWALLPRCPLPRGGARGSAGLERGVKLQAFGHPALGRPTRRDFRAQA